MDDDPEDYEDDGDEQDDEEIEDEGDEDDVSNLTSNRKGPACRVSNSCLVRNTHRLLITTG
jgi:hypothetical protein